MNIEQNMNMAIRRLLQECEKSNSELVSYLIKCRSKLIKYLMDKEKFDDADRIELETLMGIDGALFEDRSRMEGEVAFYIAILDTLLFLGLVAPYKRRHYILVLIMCVRLRNNRAPIKWSQKRINELLSYSFRYKMCIEAVRTYHSSNGMSAFSVCPRCNSSLEREYQSFCDRCGQALSWKDLRKVKAT